MMKKEDLRILFLGTPEFAVESLDRIVREGYRVVGVVTMPDKPAGRGHRMYQSPVKEYALAHSLPLLQPASLKDPDFLSSLDRLGANLNVVIAFRMLPREVWQRPALGTFNLHASLLPRYRGAAPINWAVINGDTETGVTTFFLRHEIDTGDIIGQSRVAIGPDDNVGQVHDRLMHLGADLTADTLARIVAGDVAPVPQQELLKGEQPTPAPKIFKDTCRLNFSQPARKVHNLVRGLSPYPAAWADLLDADHPDRPALTQLKVFKTAVVPADHGADNPAQPAPEPASATLPAGSVEIRDGRMFVACGDEARVELLEVQPSGKRRMAVADFLRGARLPARVTF